MKPARPLLCSEGHQGQMTGTGQREVWDPSRGSPPSRLSAWAASTGQAHLQPGRSTVCCRRVSSSSWNGSCWNSATRHTVSNILCNKYFKKRTLLMLCLVPRSPLVRYSFQQLTDPHAVLSPRKSGWGPFVQLPLPRLLIPEQKPFCPWNEPSHPGQGPSFLWADLGFWALTTG